MKTAPEGAVFCSRYSHQLRFGALVDAKIAFMKMGKRVFLIVASGILFCMGTVPAHAALELTAGNNATTTPNVATSITGFQIVGNAASTTPVKLRATSGTLNLSSVSGVTMSGNGTGTVNLSGTVSLLNSALATLTYTRGSTGTDTLEVSLVEAGEVFFEGNGHLYQYIADAGTWNAAKTKAEALTRYGATGYLATITSDSENVFVTARLSNAGWMGANDGVVEGAWRWVTGPENGTQFWSGTSGGSTVGGNYANWGTGEPNNAGDEDCGQYLAGGTGKWNDLPCGSTSLPGYVAEFGADGNMPTVVAQNVSIVTADVPAVTSLFPLNGATTATSTTNLVIRFTKTVTPQTGNILIRKASDDSIVETVDVAGGLLSGGGTTAITINPASALPEGTEFYITVPSTAFKDSSDNFFSGFTDDSTWVFTTIDENAPVISNLAATTATTTASVTWTTNENASTRLWYSANLSYASSTAEANTSTRVTSHSASLSDLVACTLYSYKAVSRDLSGNAATSTAAAFTTTGCSGGVAPTSATTSAITVSGAATTTLSESGRILTVETPPDFTATSTSVVIQIKSMNAPTVLGSIGKPSEALSSAASIVFNVTALIDNVTELDSFDVPVTVSYAYTDADILGLDENTLSMYHYKDAIWSELDSCSVDTAANTITCTAPHFSVFAIFGTPPASGSSGSSGTTLLGRIRNLETSGNLAKAHALRAEYGLTPSVTPGTGAPASIAVRDLELGMSGEDVRMLQKLLNANGHPLASTGVGAQGSETEYFGSLTQAAVIAYQKEHGVLPSVGYFGPLTRASMKSAALSGLWW